jgi:hypothetical protein
VVRFYVDRQVVGGCCVAPCLLSSPEARVGRLRGIPWKHGYRTVRLDMTEFFVSGDATQLPNAVGELFVGMPIRSLVTEVCFWLLATQTIQCRALPGRLWQVTTASGMRFSQSS